VIGVISVNDKFNETMKFEAPKEKTSSVNEIIFSTFSSLEEKGYNSINQIIGYILSGDPSYITSHNNARCIICNVERDELLEELLDFYLENNTRQNIEE
jgi:uncharacterized protein (UPF0297 family)